MIAIGVTSTQRVTEGLRHDGWSARLLRHRGANITTVSLLATALPPGDANGDGTVTVGDVFYLINYLFAAGLSPVGSGDANGDNSTTVGDVFYLINYLFAGGPAPI